MKSIALGMIGGLILSFAAQAQAPGQPDRQIRAPYITGTGATVDKPGEPQGSAPTRLDRNIQRENNQIDKSICKGC